MQHVSYRLVDNPPQLCTGIGKVGKGGNTYMNQYHTQHGYDSEIFNVLFLLHSHSSTHSPFVRNCSTSRTKFSVLET